MRAEWKQFSFHERPREKPRYRDSHWRGGCTISYAMKTTTLEREVEKLQEAAKSPIIADAIEELAYRYWLERGCPYGSPEDDWYRAERELRALAA